MSWRVIVWGLVGLLALTICGWAGWRWRQSVRLDREAAIAADEVARGEFDAARRRLRGLVRARPADPALAYDLGYCEQRLGYLDAAAEAWARVAPGTPLGAMAAVGRAEIEIQRGRLARAEELLRGAADRPRTGPEAALVVDLQLGLARLELRTAEVRPLVEKLWAMIPQAGRDALWKEVTPPRELLRQYAAVDLDPPATGALRQALTKAASQAADDDRVALGLANLALREGDLAEADRQLRRCESSRPTDPAVLRGRLDWAMASGDSGRARQALDAMPAGLLDLSALVELRAWFARERGDTAVERAALERWLELEPASTTALGRLADLAAVAGDLDRARTLRARKTTADARLHAYRAAYFQADPAVRGPELAAQAEALGRWFEARGWWRLYALAHPGDPSAREHLARLATPTVAPDPSLRARILDESRPSGSSPASGVNVVSGGASIRFEDRAQTSGLTFQHDNGETDQRQLPETMSGGVALFDADGDGRLDVFCVQGGPLLPDPSRPAGSAGDRLFRNRGDGTFEDLTQRCRLAGAVLGYGNGVAVGDVDNDGRPDLFLTRLDRYQLFRNNADGTFEDVTARWGLAGPRDWPTSAAFADLDGDGDLDLYVCHYGAWDVRDPLLCRNATGRPSYCPPRSISATADRLFRNDGGRFVDVSREAGIVDTEGRGLGVLAADLDGDRRVDLFVANDTTANYLWRNLGGLKFEEAGEVAGVAASASGGFQAGMGVALGDLDGDGRLDLAVTNFYGEATTVFQNLGGGMFADQTATFGLRAATRHLLGFGTVFLDADNDGRLDLLTVNGHVTDNQPEFPYRMPAQLLAGQPGGRLVDVSASAGPVFAVPRLGRGLAAGDVDNDGRVDAVAIDQNRPVVYLHNESRGGSWIRFALEGVASNRDAVGAVVAVEVGGRRRVAARFGGGSYQSASDGRVHFGLGVATRVDRVEVAWPSGRVDRFENLDVNRDYRLREGSPAPVR